MTSTVFARAPVPVPSEASGFHGEYLRGEARALAFLPRHPSRDEDWERRISEAASGPGAREVWERAHADAERLGACPESLENLRALAAGDALCVTAGQQPGLFLGPLYTVYKAMTAVALARSVAERSKRRTVPVFWNAADDSDFGEVGSAFFAGEAFRLTRHSLDGGELPAGGLVGDLSSAGTRRELDEARESFRGRPAGPALLEHLERALSLAEDHGELTTALLYDLFRETGLVVVDGRWPELRRAAAPLFTRYAEKREEVATAVVGAGTALEHAGYRARLPEASARGALFDLRDGRRRPFEGTPADLLARIADAPETLSPNVLLRPAVQDFLFPNVATIGGPGEISYHAQLAPEYELLGLSMPILFPRFEATLVPSGVFDLAQRREAPVADFVRDFDATMKATAARGLPDALRAGLDDLERTLTERIERVRPEAERFEKKLAGAVDDTARRALDAVRKLREKAAAAARSAETRRDPAVKSYREFLRPRGVPQERVLSALTLFLESTSHPLDCLDEALDKHVAAARESRPLHWLLDFGGCRGGGTA